MVSESSAGYSSGHSLSAGKGFGSKAKKIRTRRDAFDYGIGAKCIFASIDGRL